MKLPAPTIFNGQKMDGFFSPRHRTGHSRPFTFLKGNTQTHTHRHMPYTYMYTNTPINDLLDTFMDKKENYVARRLSVVSSWFDCGASGAD